MEKGSCYLFHPKWSHTSYGNLIQQEQRGAGADRVTGAESARIRMRSGRAISAALVLLLVGGFCDWQFTEHRHDEYQQGEAGEDELAQK